MLKHMLLALLAAASPLVAGELMVHPTRVVFEGSTRTAQLDVINSGTETMTYRISVVRRRMTATGEFTPVDEARADERFADDMIRFSPRQVVLPPGAAQAVRVQLRKPANLEDGEYRSHLLFQALPPAPKPARETVTPPAEDLDIRLTAIYSISIPLIVRHGAISAEVAIRDVAVDHSAVTFVLDRTGRRSVYGDLVVSIRSGRGPERVIARANGVAVYAPNESRAVRLPLPTHGSPLPPGEMRVTFAERREQPGRIEAQTRLSVH